MKPGLDPLGDRFKPIEREWRTFIPSDQFMVVRVDGKAFHTWTRGLRRPYSEHFLDAMDFMTEKLVSEIPDALCGYTQSDEASVICGPLLNEGSQRWFGGGVQKIVSVSASVASAAFNYGWHIFEGEGTRNVPKVGNLAYFDARVFPLDDVGEAADYLWWRQSDARRNAVTMMADHLVGHRHLDGKTTEERRAILIAHGINLDEDAPRFLNGGLIHHVERAGSSVNPVTQEVVEFTRRDLTTEPADLLRNWFYDNYVTMFDGPDVSV